MGLTATSVPEPITLFLLVSYVVTLKIVLNLHNMVFRFFSLFPKKLGELGIAATLFDSIRAFLISSMVSMLTGPVCGVRGLVGVAGGVLRGLLGGDPTRDQVNEPGGDETPGSLALSVTTLKGAGLTGDLPGDLDFLSGSGSNGNIIGAGLSLRVTLGSAIRVLSPSESESAPSKGSPVLSKPGLVEKGIIWGRPTFLSGVP